MSKAPTAIGIADKNPEDKMSTIDFRFGKDSKIQPSGMEGLTLDEEVTVTLKGTITSFSAGGPYQSGKNFSLKMSSCEIIQPDNAAPEETSMDDALMAANSSRKMMM